MLSGANLELADLEMSLKTFIPQKPKNLEGLDVTLASQTLKEEKRL